MSKKKKFRVDLEQFNSERDKSLLTFDEKTIRRFCEKYEVNAILEAKTSLLFWASVCKAITGIPTLPLAARLRAKRFLDKNKFQSFDDGGLGKVLADAKNKNKK